MGWLSFRLPVDPRNLASPKLKTPPSDPRSQYPLPEAVEAMPTIGLFSPPLTEPRAGASPAARTLPCGVTTQAPLPEGVAAAAATVVPAGTATGSFTGTPSRMATTPPGTDTAAVGGS